MLQNHSNKRRARAHTQRIDLARVGERREMLPPSAVSRRALLALAPALSAFPVLVPPLPAFASRPISDPRFSLLLPDGFAVSKRKATQGTLFVAGDFPRAAVVAVSAVPISDLITEEQQVQSLPGMAAQAPVAGLSSFTSLADVQQVLGGGTTDGLTRVLMRRRDRDASSGALMSKLVSFELSGARLSWISSTELSVADPEELYKQRGVRKLIRQTAAVSVLSSVPALNSAGGPSSTERVPAIISCFASALEADWTPSELGTVLQTAVASFEVTGA